MFKLNFSENLLLDKRQGTCELCYHSRIDHNHKANFVQKIAFRYVVALSRELLQSRISWCTCDFKIHEYLREFEDETLRVKKKIICPVK